MEDRAFAVHKKSNLSITQVRVGVDTSTWHIGFIQKPNEQSKVTFSIFRISTAEPLKNRILKSMDPFNFNLTKNTVVANKCNNYSMWKKTIALLFFLPNYANYRKITQKITSSWLAWFGKLEILYHTLVLKLTIFFYIEKCSVRFTSKTKAYQQSDYPSKRT